MIGVGTENLEKVVGHGGLGFEFKFKNQNESKAQSWALEEESKKGDYT